MTSAARSNAEERERQLPRDAAAIRNAPPNRTSEQGASLRCPAWEGDRWSCRGEELYLITKLSGLKGLDNGRIAAEKAAEAPPLPSAFSRGDEGEEQNA